MSPADGGGPLTESHCYPSYSQAGEDRIVFYVFERLGRTAGLRYADVGAALPPGHNNTYLFYTMGGSCLLVEADPMYGPAYAALRPRDRTESIAVVPARLRARDHVTFHRFEDLGWSTVSAEHRAAGARLGKGPKGEITVPCATINEVLERHFPPAELDLLSLDIEGVDGEVLQELDLDRFRPKAIIVEGFPGTVAGYRLVATTPINSIFVHEACMEGFRS